MTKNNIMYLGMVTLYNSKGVGHESISFVAFDKEKAKKQLASIAGDVLTEFVDAYEVKNDEIDNEAIVLECNESWPRKVMYWIKEVECIDGP